MTDDLAGILPNIPGFNFSAKHKEEVCLCDLYNLQRGCVSITVPCGRYEFCFYLYFVLISVATALFPFFFVGGGGGD